MGGFRLRVEMEAFNFNAAHFLLFPDGSREPLHGHNYRVWVEVEGDLAPGHYVLDYCTFKPLVKNVCDELDHRMLLPAGAEALRVWQEGALVLAEHRDGSRFSFPSKDCLVLDLPNTSTELLSKLLARRIYEQLIKRNEHKHLAAITVGVEEAPGQQSSYRYELPHVTGRTDLGTSD
jgi:6-pyruvoyltetrahydropterin/6-carboxytetrahydropterin synthase